MQKLYSEVNWNIDIERSLLVVHNIQVRLFNTDGALPSVQDRISVGLPRRGSFKNFETSIDGQSLLPGHGFLPGQNLYSLTLDEVRRRATRIPAEVTISFEERGAVQESRGLCFYDVNFVPRLFQAALELKMKPPSAESSWRSTIARLLCKVARAPEVPQVQYLGREPTRAGGDMTVFNFRDDFPPFGVLFTRQYAIDKASLISGFIGGVVVSGIGGLIAWLCTRGGQ